MALQFDGVNDWTYNFLWNSPATNTFTIGARIFRDTSADAGICFNWGDEFVRGMFHLHIASNALRLGISESDTTEIAATGGSLTTSTWYAVAGQADGSNIRVFLDGAQVGSDVAYDGTLDQTRAGISIGARMDDGLASVAGTFPVFFPGRIAEVFISTAVWSVAEIAAFNTYSPLAIRRGVAGYWPMINSSAMQDLIGGSTLIVDGPVSGDHPRIILPRRRRGAKIAINVQPETLFAQACL